MKTPTIYKRIVFCDFDGTITAEETFVAMLKHFAAKPYDEMEKLLVEGRVTLRQAVRSLVESIPSVRYPHIIEFVKDKPIRPGFPELLDFLYFHGVPLVVISGGLMGSVAVKLAPFEHRIHAMYAAEVDADKEFLRVHSIFESDTELVAKTRVMELYPCEQSIVIGDGITDLNGAMAADLVFARDGLCRYLAKKSRPFIRWEDFFDVCNHLSKRWLADDPDFGRL
ncbi:MAG: HAD-IB family phosphatase [Desulfobacterales bacterium]